jgi:hypothetical protein
MSINQNDAKPLCDHMQRHLQSVTTPTGMYRHLFRVLRSQAEGLADTSHHLWAVMLYNLCLLVLAPNSMNLVYFEAVKDGLWEVPAEDREFFNTLRSYNAQLGKNKMQAPICFTMRTVPGGFVVGIDKCLSLNTLASHLRDIGYEEEVLLQIATIFTERFGKQTCNEAGEMMDVMTIFRKGTNT